VTFLTSCRPDVRGGGYKPYGRFQHFGGNLSREILTSCGSGLVKYVCDEKNVSLLPCPMVYGKRHYFSGNDRAADAWADGPELNTLHWRVGGSAGTYPPRAKVKSELPEC